MRPESKHEPVATKAKKIIYEFRQAVAKSLVSLLEEFLRVEKTHEQLFSAIDFRILYQPDLIDNSERQKLRDFISPLKERELHNNLSDPLELVVLGLAYDLLDNNYYKANYCYELSNERHNNGYALYLMARAHLLGRIEPAMLSKAVVYLELSIEFGNLTALNNLGKLHYYNEIPNANMEKGLLLLQEAADKGNIIALSNLGQILEQKQPFNAEKIIPIYERAGMLGCDHSLVRMGAYILEKLQAYESDSLSNAFAYFEAATAIGNAEAKTYLGIMNRKGRGIKKDTKKARELFLAAAKMRDPGGLYQLADMYQIGQGGEKNLTLAEYYHQLALEAGCKDSAMQLTKIYLKQRKYLKAFTIFRQYYFPTIHEYSADQSIKNLALTLCETFSLIMLRENPQEITKKELDEINYIHAFTQQNILLIDFFDSEPRLVVKLLIKDLENKNRKIYEHSIDLMETIYQRGKNLTNVEREVIAFHLGVHYAQNGDEKAFIYFASVQPDYLTAEQNFETGLYQDLHYSKMSALKKPSNPQQQMEPAENKDDDGKIFYLAYFFLLYAAHQGSLDASMLLLNLVHSRKKQTGIINRKIKQSIANYYPFLSGQFIPREHSPPQLEYKQNDEKYSSSDVYYQLQKKFLPIWSQINYLEISSHDNSQGREDFLQFKSIVTAVYNCLFVLQELNLIKLLEEIQGALNGLNKIQTNLQGNELFINTRALISDMINIITAEIPKVVVNSLSL